ncbi:glucoamylase family protein [Massilia sp. R2A-15]|uniref:glucoamylase family protein n=1 Tax=Massilia sp. R2A-15 TaxID=3064278 RepID=UPI0027322C68|nr:glucoamylase family protein [Massilia sp. R2A-15]WLI91639.1 glucoamylase family protein [Massilia sp. R2A-15]
MFRRLIPLAALLCGCASVIQTAQVPVPVPVQQPVRIDQAKPYLDDLSERTFRFFWDTANPANGLVPDRYPSPSFSSIAAVGFGLTAYPIGVERGYVTRADARGRVLTTLRFFHDAPQGPAAQGMSGYKGFFYHFLDMKTGARSSNSELSTVDTALLLGGVLHVQSYFDGADPQEAEIRRLADDIYRRVDWRWAQNHGAAITHGWNPEHGMLPYDWKGYNEAMLVYILALGSPTHPVGADAWAEWTQTYDKSWGRQYGQEYLAFPPHFGHQYSAVWIDFRGIRDSYMQAKGIDYFENSRRASYAQQAYAIANPMACKGYGQNMWGVTASDGPADIVIADGARKRKFISYAGRGMGGEATYDDCTMAPTGAAASIAFAPEIAIPAIVDMRNRYGDYIYGKYGFLDAFNLTFDFDVKLANGRRIPGFGWVDTDYLGIDQGPILAMVENYRSDMVWRVTRKNPYLRAGLLKAGFRGGWLDAAQ